MLFNGHFHSHPERPCMCHSLKCKVTRALLWTHLFLAVCIPVSSVFPSILTTTQQSLIFSIPAKRLALVQWVTTLLLNPMVNSEHMIYIWLFFFLKIYYWFDFKDVLLLLLFSFLLIWCPLVFFTGLSCLSLSVWEPQDTSSSSTLMSLMISSNWRF